MLLCAKYIQDNMFKIILESAEFCRQCDKNTGVFRFTVSIVVHLQNAPTKFDKI